MAKLAYKGGTPVRNTQSHPWPAWPPYDQREEKALLEVLHSRNWGGYPAPNVKASEFGRKFAKAQDASYGICAANGTVTLEVALKAAGIKAGDEVIAPSLTWIATGAAAVYVNAVPVFADVTEDNYTIDPDHVESLITDRTRAVIVVHLGSSAADLDRFTAICKKHDLVLIEDCAHAHGGKWRGKGLGSWGDFGSWSFQSSKLMTAGEGGMLTTSNKTLEEKTQCFVNCGRKEWGYNSFEGNPFGYNYRMSEFQTAVLLAQLEKLPEYTALRAENADYFTKLLKETDGFEILKQDERLTTAHHYQYVFKYKAEAFKGLHRDKFIEALSSEGVELDGDFYEPMQDRPIFKPSLNEYPVLKGRYPNGITRESVSTPVASKAAYNETLWMHYHYLMGGKKDVEQVVEAMVKVRDNVDELK